jgi:hypothetical protein
MITFYRKIRKAGITNCRIAQSTNIIVVNQFLAFLAGIKMLIYTCRTVVIIPVFKHGCIRYFFTAFLALDKLLFYTCRTVEIAVYFFAMLDLDRFATLRAFGQQILGTILAI